MIALVVTLFIGSVGPAGMAGLPGGALAGCAGRAGAASPAVADTLMGTAAAQLQAIEPGHHPGHRVGALAGRGVDLFRRRAGRTWERLGRPGSAVQRPGRVVDPSIWARCAARAAGLRRRPTFAAEASSSGPEEPEPGYGPSHPGPARSAPSPASLLLPSRELV